ncbi:glycosyltransferase family 2 protein [Kocuria rhizophila]|uniref:Putative glycosyltransferase n=1 Tax=Kocuria rhizophila (strain ATCC 9341 / DSM 348 / NBRC 103217 / DC2201) TaxID=378753 RepID=B2GLA0_KOCRD|nr:glycosyltransferase family A protein [Kocuria rhizophila]ASE12152.1 glycosyltransferase family 2 protein [Kocuria rhizophila]BAG30056.1 putative glycosyltransferase [Kocuria rhizophila DC2201]VEH74674.1 Chondroitin polymerase [Kocuria rhizophila]
MGKRTPAGTTGEQPLVSVVIAVYNGQDMVGQAISSVLRQTHPSIEVFVVDDGSTDHTPEVLAGYEALDRPGRAVRVLRQENAGCGAARNRALELISGDYVTFLDADDELLPHHLETMLERYRQLQREPGRERTVVYTNAWQCTPSGINAERMVNREAMPAPEDQRSVILEYNIGHLFGLFPRAFFEEVGTFDPEQVFVEDWELWLRAVYSGWRFDRVDEVTVILSWSGSSMQSQRDRMAAGEEMALRKTLVRFEQELSPEERDKLLTRLRNGSPLAAASDAEQAMREGRTRDAREHLETAARMMPSQRRVALKARIARVPGGMHWLVRRQRAVDRSVGYTDAMRR